VADSGEVSTKQEQRREEWRQRVGQQESSGQSIRGFCRERGLKEHAFYGWRQRLRKQNTPVRFALVESKSAANSVPPIELMLASGDRLRIPNDAATLKLVLAVLREQA
jgi:putative transposase